jgi:hypothetical protein
VIRLVGTTEEEAGLPFHGNGMLRRREWWGNERGAGEIEGRMGLAVAFICFMWIDSHSILMIILFTFVGKTSPIT